jgi:DNA-3-methyladenine glycosylase
MAGVILDIKRLRQRKKTKIFFQRPAEYVAKNLLGDLLVLCKNKSILVGKIVETEAYLGREDEASHSFGGKITLRNQVMYSEGGKIYTYLIYGKFWCFNIVASKKDDPQAVFIRALEPLYGIRTMLRNRSGNHNNLTNGPCRWTTAFGINKTFLGRDILSDKLFIASGQAKNFEIVETKRIGIDYATRSKDLPLRFYIKGSPFVSKR